MAAEHSDTGQVFARCVAAIEPEWLEEAAAHIAKRRYSSARWDAARGEAIVLETVTVYGLTVASERPRRAAEVDLEAARELFALEGLVRVDQRVRGGFLARNALLVRRVQDAQGKLRRMDLLASEQARAAFYLARLPADVCSVATWERYATRATAAELAKFEMREADVLPSPSRGRPRDEDFPPVLRLGPDGLAAQSGGDADDGAGAAAKLAYKFAPGAPDDGITVRVDLAGFARVDADALEWLVPGFLGGEVPGLGEGAAETLAPATRAGGRPRGHAGAASTGTECLSAGPLGTRRFRSPRSSASVCACRPRSGREWTPCRRTCA